MGSMNAMDADLLTVVRGCYGAVRIRDLELTRTQRRHIASLVGAGELIAHEHGVIGIPGAERTVVLARIHGGLLTCQAAMRYYGLPVAQGAEQVHLVVTPGRRFSTAGREVLHADRYRTLMSPTSYPVQPLPEALARFLRCHVQDDSPLIALDAALHDERVTAEQVRDLLRGPGSARALARLERASDRARSPLETLARMDLEAAGLSFEDGVEIEGVGEVDLVLSRRPQAIVPGPANGTRILTAAACPALLIETDGYTYHSSRPDWHSDHLRDQAALARGHTPLRLTSNQVVDRETVRIVSSVARRLGIHPDVTPGDF